MGDYTENRFKLLKTVQFLILLFHLLIDHL